ncbi:AAA family ATPase [Mycoplasma sp. P36-A1]|uniref:SF1B family DNA helicase RecD2 n=1 Tax=Mycoplasma sp. P36-A1 TaxID=3252900 RepID=UPI003C308C2B
MSDKLVGKVKKIIFSNTDANFYILSIKTITDEETITGTFANIKENVEYEFEGEYVNHIKYGQQFKAYSAKLLLPEEKDSIISYLSSKQFNGIGKVMATKIYEQYQTYDDILQAIVQKPEELDLVKGMSVKKDAFLSILTEELKNNILLDFVSKLNVNYADVMKMFNKSNLKSDEFITILKNNPYDLIFNDIKFNEIEQVAISLEIENAEDKRIQAYLFSLIKEIGFSTGSTYIEKSFLFDVINRKQQIFLDQESLNSNLENLEKERHIYIEDTEKIYEKDQYDYEKTIADFLNEYSLSKVDNNVDAIITEYENIKGITFNSEQRQAIINGATSQISIITGGPGTGKSTVVDALVYILKKQDRKQRIALCAPTGKASKRLGELTQKQAMTIHKLLKYDMNDNTFGQNVFAPLEYDVLIVDESSMIDNFVMASLLKACQFISKIIFLGDYNQLPSVGQGQVLKDMIESNKLYTTTLNQIYRQKEGSSIIDLAYKILNKQEISESDFQNDDLNLIDISNSKEILKQVNDFIEKTTNGKDQVILSPMYKGRFGIDKLNLAIQKKRFNDVDKKFSKDDLVIQLVNRNDDEIYNGDVGIVDSSQNAGIVVNYDGKYIEYKKADYDQIKLAYCISIHKSQGNEYDEVLIFLSKDNLHFIDKKIMYTAITRAKNKLTIISTINILNTASNNEITNQRKSGLVDKLIKNT